MFLSLLGAILYPLLVSSSSKFAPIRGGVIGVMLAFVVGFFMPTSTIRQEVLTPLRLEKSSDVDGRTNFHMVTLDASHRIRFINLTQHNHTIGFADNLVISVSSQLAKVQIFSCRTVMEPKWAWMFASSLPSETFEIEIPSTMIDKTLAPANTNGTATVLYEATPEESSNSVAINQK